MADLRWIPPSGPAVRLAMPPPSAPYAEVPEPCSCGCDVVAGRDPVEDHDTITSRAWCPVCEAARGVLVVRVSTIFGLQEDRAVTDGPWRVY